MEGAIQTVILNQQNNSAPPSTTDGYANQLKLSLGLPMWLKGKEICLYQLFMYYSWFNISESNGNNKFQLVLKHKSGVNPIATIVYDITLKDGSYSISDINDYIRDFMFTKKLGYFPSSAAGTDYSEDTFVPGITLAVDNVRYCCRIIPIVTGNGYFSSLFNSYHIIIPDTPHPAGKTDTETARSLSQILGFPPGMYPKEPTSSGVIDEGEVLDNIDNEPEPRVVYGVSAPYPPDLTTTNQVNVACNMVNNSLVSANQSSTIYSFSPSVPFGSQIAVNPNQLVWYPIVDGQYSSIDIKLLDDDFRPLQIRDPVLSCTVLIRSKGESL